MDRLQKALAVLALGTVPVVGAASVYALYEIGHAARTASMARAPVAQIAAQAQATLETLNRPCPGPHDAIIKPCGTLADVAKALDTVRGTFGQIEVAAHHEDANLTTLDRQENLLVGDLHQTIQSSDKTITILAQTAQDATATLQTVRTTVQGLQPVEGAATQALDQVAHTTTAIDQFITSPELAKTQQGIATTATNFGLMTTDAQIKFHALLFPPPCKGWRCNLNTTINDIRLGSQFIEPAFYLRQLLTGERINGTITVVPQK